MKTLISFLLISLLVACNSINKPKKPDNLIPEEEMINILYDVFILNAGKGASKSVLEKNGILPENYIFEKYKIDSIQFSESNAYYGSDIEAYESIIVKVDERIQIDKVKYQTLVDDETKEKQRIKDSVKKSFDTLKLRKPREPIKIEELKG